MKTKFVTIFALTALAITARADTARNTFESLAKEIPAPIQNVFVPQGFDSDDISEIVISGTFPNSCYKMGNISHKYNDVEKKIFVTVSAYHIDSDYCLTINVPFLQVVSLGLLEAGKYPIVVNNVLNTSIPVKQARPNNDRSDDFLYASVYGLIQKDMRAFEIQGTSPNACYEVSEVRVLSESKDIVLVQPIMSKVAGCDEEVNNKRVAWIRRFEVSENLAGKVLIHVRTLGGGSINQVVDL